jgi:hypothetical protein
LVQEISWPNVFIAHDYCLRWYARALCVRGKSIGNFVADSTQAACKLWPVVHHRSKYDALDMIGREMIGESPVRSYPLH